MDKILNYILKIPDKILHFGVSFAVEIVLAVALPMWQPWARFSANVIVVGGGKELYDYLHPYGHEASFTDLLADAAGAISAEIVIALLR